MDLTRSIPSGDTVYLQEGIRQGYYLSLRAFGKGRAMRFEDDQFNCPSNPELYLEQMYGDYMRLPPEEERENRHQILELRF